jgi:hypothetical protein
MRRIAAALGALVLIAAAVDATKIQLNFQARLRSVKDEWGQKLKLSWKWVDRDTSEYELCVGCEIDESGKRVGNKGIVGKGGTCGGAPNGCYSIKGKALQWGATLEIAVRYGRGDHGFFSPWGSKVSYFIDPALNNGRVNQIKPVPSIDPTETADEQAKQEAAKGADEQDMQEAAKADAQAKQEAAKGGDEQAPSMDPPSIVKEDPVPEGALPDSKGGVAAAIEEEL